MRNYSFACVALPQILPQYIPHIFWLLFALFLGHSSLAAASSWDTLLLEHFYIHYQAVDSRIADRLARHAGDVYQNITNSVGYTSSRKIVVYLCPTPECFQQKQPLGTSVPEWAVGVAYPSLNRIVMRSALTLAEQGPIKPVEIFKHEVAHIILEQSLADRGGAPRWLSEGFSMYHARQWTVYGQRTIEEVTLRENFLPLAMLTTTFPADEQTARIAYAQSFSVVAFLLDEYGESIFRKFIENLQQGMDTDTALAYSAGVNVKRLELEWQAALKKRYSWISYLTNIGLFWFILSVGFLMVYVIKRRKVKHIREQWEAEEDVEPGDAV